MFKESPLVSHPIRAYISTYLVRRITRQPVTWFSDRVPRVFSHMMTLLQGAQRQEEDGSAFSVRVVKY